MGLRDDMLHGLGDGRHDDLCLIGSSIRSDVQRHWTFILPIALADHNALEGGTKWLDSCGWRLASGRDGDGTGYLVVVSFCECTMQLVLLSGHHQGEVLLVLAHVLRRLVEDRVAKVLWTVVVGRS